MAIKSLDPAFEQSVNQKFRMKRFLFFLSLLKRIKMLNPGKTIQILDIGGTEIYWERMKFLGNNDVNITLLNLTLETVKNKNFNSVVGDACDLSNFVDGQFDLVYSNSVIEHLFSWENQQKMAKEVRRVGNSYYIQTPNFYFPIEPHWLFPFFQFFPFWLKVSLTRNFDLGHYNKTINKKDAIVRVNEVKLLTKREMKMLFPDGEVYLEKFFGLTKSTTSYYLQKV